jgi:hypothetical protein
MGGLFVRRANLQCKFGFLKRLVIGILPGQIVFVALTAWAFLPVESRADFLLGQASNYAVLVEPNLHNFGLTSDSGVFGNVGIGSPINAVQLAGGIITGNLDFSLLPPSGGPNFGGTVVGSVGVNVAAVTSALNTVNSLNTTLGAESGTALVVTGAGQTINASAGTLDGSGNRVFRVASASQFNLSGGITINGSASDFVVINILQGTSNEKINGAVSLTGGITSDQVLFNFVGTGGELGAAANKAVASGIFLAPNMKVNIDAVTIDGRLFGGGSLTSNNDFKIVSNAFVNQPPSSSAAVPEPASLTLFGTAIIGLIGWHWRRRRMAA